MADEIRTRIRYVGDDSGLKKLQASHKEYERKVTQGNRLISHSITEVNTRYDGTRKVIERNVTVLKKASGLTNALITQVKHLVGAFLGFLAVHRLLLAVSGGIRAIVDAATKLEQTQLLFRSFGLTVQQAHQRYKDFIDFAIKSPLEIAEIMDASVMIETFNQATVRTVEGFEKMKDIIQTFGVVAKATGRDIGDMLGAAYQAGQGTFITRQLAHALIDPTQLKKDIKEGMTAIDAFLKQYKEKFGLMAKEVGGTLTVMLSNIKDTMFKVWTIIGEAILPDLKDLIQVIYDELDNLRAWIEANRGKLADMFRDAIQGAKDFWGHLKATVDILWKLKEVILIVAGAAVLGNLISSIGALVAGVKALAAGIGVLAATAAGGIVLPVVITVAVMGAGWALQMIAGKAGISVPGVHGGLSQGLGLAYDALTGNLNVPGRSTYGGLPDAAARREVQFPSGGLGGLGGGLPKAGGGGGGGGKGGAADAEKAAREELQRWTAEVENFRSELEKNEATWARFGDIAGLMNGAIIEATTANDQYTLSVRNTADAAREAAAALNAQAALRNIAAGAQPTMGVIDRWKRSGIYARTVGRGGGKEEGGGPWYKSPFARELGQTSLGILESGGNAKGLIRGILPMVGAHYLGPIVGAIGKLLGGLLKDREPLRPDVIYNVKVVNPEDIADEFLRATQAQRLRESGRGVDAFHQSIERGSVALGYS